ncbi:peptidoglycan bridge formation glycyltransferase FemA/FemB family protein [uncultured Clostridium sp.]|uniref:peptidoglycan bridge formation glycyltransferase FemA/FemB family protein n=1 Tax=uncultured Clostridium sp. TaxID=59620 RepID=UPI002628A5FC|nr:peptidoglycan bridge formation glycyltransferase FemA/FemB family protein [uncultured Clostridium sp.]
MYNFKEVSPEVVNEFNASSKKGHIFQTSYWADLKEYWIPKFIAGYDSNGEVVLATTIHLRKFPKLNTYMGYIPRGFTCDYTNKSLVSEFTDFLKKFSKENKVAFVTVDPDIHLRENEELIEEGNNIKEHLKSLGYKNTESKNFEGIQPNFVFRLPLPTEGDKAVIKKQVFKSFSSKTRYNIKVAEERGLTVEIFDKESLTDEVMSKFHEIMVTTGKRDNFIVRGKDYFKNMIDCLYPHARLYMVKYSYENDFKRLTEKLSKQESDIIKSLAKIEDQKAKFALETDEDKKSRIQKKITDNERKVAESERQIEGFKSKIEGIKPYKGQDLYLSGSLYLYHGDIGWYLYGASDNKLRDTMPNFAMQWAMIEDTVDLGCPVYDFRGVSGDLNPENPLYGLYKFKKGFNGNFVEFIGEFDIVTNTFMYNLYKKAFPEFKKIRNKMMNKKQ